MSSKSLICSSSRRGRRRLVRNHGPFPYIQCEGIWKPLPGKPSKTSQAIVPRARSCPPPADPDQIAALIRYQQLLELDAARARRLKQRNRPRQPPPPPPLLDQDFPRAHDPLTSPLWWQGEGSTAWNRLYTHHTLNSVRRHAQLKRIYEPQDKLDLALSSCYQHDLSLWARWQDICLQPETLGAPSWRVLRNLRVVLQDPELPRGHPMIQGGVDTKTSVHSVKLAISGNHVSQTNAGFSRKVDGTFYS